MLTGRTELVGRLLVVGFTVERISLADTPPWMLSLSMTLSILHCAYCPLTLVTFCFTFSHLLPAWKKQPSHCAPWEGGFGPTTASFLSAFNQSSCYQTHLHTHFHSDNNSGVLQCNFNYFSVFSTHCPHMLRPAKSVITYPTGFQLSKFNCHSVFYSLF